MRPQENKEGGQVSSTDSLFLSHQGPPSSSSFVSISHASAGINSNGEEGICEKKCNKCVVNQEQSKVLGEGASFARFVGYLCHLKNNNFISFSSSSSSPPSSPLSSPSNPISPLSFSFMIVRLCDGRVVEGELLGVDSNCSLLLRNLKEKIFLPWPSLESLSLNCGKKNFERKKCEGEEAGEKGRKPPAEVYVQLVERERQLVFIRNSQIKSISISSKTFEEALAQTQTNPPFVLL